MDADERDICSYLKSWAGQFVSGREISRRAGGKWRHSKDPEWAGLVLTRMVEKAILEKDASGRYRLIAKMKEKKKKWVSPEIEKILRESGKVFEFPTDEDDGEL
jgi:hypothetical protein